MSVKSKSFASTINNSKMILAGYQKHGADLSFASADAGKLQDLLTMAEALNVKQEQLKADLAKTSEELDGVIGDSKKVYASLLRFAKGKFGPKSKEIKDFVPTGEM